MATRAGSDAYLADAHGDRPHVRPRHPRYRRDLRIVRFVVRLGRIVLLVAGQERESDVTGTE